MFPATVGDEVSRPAVGYFVGNDTDEGTVARLESVVLGEQGMNSQ